MNNHISTGASTCNNVILVFLEEKSFRENNSSYFCVSLHDLAYDKSNKTPSDIKSCFAIGCH